MSIRPAERPLPNAFVSCDDAARREARAFWRGAAFAALMLGLGVATGIWLA